MHAQPPLHTKRFVQMCIRPMFPSNAPCHILVCIRNINQYSIGYACTQDAQSHTVGDTGPIQVCPDHFLPCVKEARHKIRVAPDDKGGCDKLAARQTGEHRMCDQVCIYEESVCVCVSLYGVTRLYMYVAMTPAMVVWREERFELGVVAVYVCTYIQISL